LATFADFEIDYLPIRNCEQNPPEVIPVIQQRKAATLHPVPKALEGALRDVLLVGNAAGQVA
jgi:hypothetical protein